YYRIQKLDWYIIKKFLGTFVFMIALIISIAVVFDINEKIDKFMSNNATINGIIFDYYLNFIPYYTNLFSPLFVFLAVIYFTSKMANNSEIIAILSNGISFRRLLKPYMISAFVIRSEEHTSELQSRENLVCRLLLEKKNTEYRYGCC